MKLYVDAIKTVLCLLVAFVALTGASSAQVIDSPATNTTSVASDIENMAEATAPTPASGA